MSTLWTPEGEHPIRQESAGTPRSEPSRSAPPGPMGPDHGPEGPVSEEEMASQLADLRDQLAKTPASTVIANHAFGLFELAALHLSVQPPQFAEAQLAIDALAALVDGMAGRLGEGENELREGLAQLRMAYVQIKAAAGAGDKPGNGSGGGEAG